MTRYERGFLTKCAEYGVDGCKLLEKFSSYTIWDGRRLSIHPDDIEHYRKNPREYRKFLNNNKGRRFTGSRYQEVTVPSLHELIRKSIENGKADIKYDTRKSVPGRGPELARTTPSTIYPVC